MVTEGDLKSCNILSINLIYVNMHLGEYLHALVIPETMPQSNPKYDEDDKLLCCLQKINKNENGLSLLEDCHQLQFGNHEKPYRRELILWYCTVAATQTTGEGYA